MQKRTAVEQVVAKSLVGGSVPAGSTTQSNRAPQSANVAAVDGNVGISFGSPKGGASVVRTPSENAAGERPSRPLQTHSLTQTTLAPQSANISGVRGNVDLVFS